MEKILEEIVLVKSKEAKKEKQKRTKEKRDQTMKKLASKLIKEDEDQRKQRKEVLFQLTHILLVFLAGGLIFTSSHNVD